MVSKPINTDGKPEAVIRLPLGRVGEYITHDDTANPENNCNYAENAPLAA